MAPLLVSRLIDLPSRGVAWVRPAARVRLARLAQKRKQKRVAEWGGRMRLRSNQPPVSRLSAKVAPGQSRMADCPQVGHWIGRSGEGAVAVALCGSSRVWYGTSEFLPDADDL